MFTVYVIKSNTKNWHYVGLTSNLHRRIKEHNSSKEKSTKPYNPFTIIYSKDFLTRIEARDYEKFLKIRSNKEKLLKSISD